jgi:quercetin dioxygenase-like cupin family protein
MNRRVREKIGELGVALAVLAPSVGMSACAEQQSLEQAATVPEVPVTAGYESARVLKAIVRPGGTAPAVWGPGDRYNLLVEGEETNDAFFQFEAVVPSGGGPPPHIHRREDESFYIVSGELELLVGDSTYRAKAGDFVFVPRGTVHGFKNVGEGTAVQLVTFVPAGMERYFHEVFPPVADPTAAPPPITDELIRKMHESAPRHGVEFPPARHGRKE